MKKRSLLCLLLVIIVVLCGCAPAAPAPTEAPAQSGQLAAPVYPEMAPYPDQESFLIEEKGEFDSEGYDQAYTAWRESRQLQYDQPAGYADSLKDFFAGSVPSFLAAQPGQNAVCSPLNIYMALALLAEVTGGDTRQQVLTLLNAPDAETLRTQARLVWNAHYSTDGANTSVLANSVWMEEGLTYDPDTLKILAEHYYASSFSGDLGTPEMDGLLRSWLNEQTGDLLEEQVQNVSMDPQTILALASTIYYRAKWTSEFYEDFNTEGAFRSPGGEIPATYMNTTLSYGPYYWSEDFSAAYLSLEDGSRMWLVLPDEGLSPEALLQKGDALKLILKEFDSWENQKSIRVNLSIPKFDVCADIRLNESLNNLGIRLAFDPAAADFTPILPGEKCWLDSVSHAARVAIDEKGVTAAAYTVMLMCGAGMPPQEEVDFILDRPFLFVITSRDNLPLFAGVVNQP